MQVLTQSSFRACPRPVASGQTLMYEFHIAVRHFFLQHLKLPQDIILQCQLFLRLLHHRLNVLARPAAT